MTDLQVLGYVVAIALGLSVAWVAVIAPIWDYVSELREFRRGAWRGEWSESRRLDILRYKRNQMVTSIVALMGAAALVMSVAILVVIVAGQNGYLGWLAMSLIGIILAHRLLDKFDPFKD